MKYFMIEYSIICVGCNVYMYIYSISHTMKLKRGEMGKKKKRTCVCGRVHKRAMCPDCGRHIHEKEGQTNGLASTRQGGVHAWVEDGKHEVLGPVRLES